jgi:hypothetical protein
MSKVHTALIILTFLVAVAGLSGDVPTTQPPVPVEIWRVGDDGLTMKVTEAIEAAFRANTSFSIAPAHQGVLIVTIPTNVRWKRRPNGTQVISEVQFSTKAKRLPGTEISCMEERLSVCAAQALQAAEKVAATLR